VQITATRAQVLVAASVVPGDGTWNVGICVENTGLASISTDFGSFWVQVTNEP